MHEYVEGPRVGYVFEDEGTAQFVRVCSKCGRFVRADDAVGFSQVNNDEPNATCSRCGRVTMPFEGWF